jgi:hypothetical protein
MKSLNIFNNFIILSVDAHWHVFRKAENFLHEDFPMPLEPTTTTTDATSTT